MSDELVHLELAVQVVVDETGQLGATLDTTKGTSLPDTAGNKLECCNLLDNIQCGREGITYAEWRSPGQQQQHQ